jgi:hypothetical protein
VESDVTRHADTVRGCAKRAESAVSTPSDLKSGSEGCAISPLDVRGIYRHVGTDLRNAVDTAHPAGTNRAPVSAQADLKTGLTAHTALIARVLDTFPGARLTARRVPEKFAEFWTDRTYEHRLRKRAETMATARLERLRKQHERPQPPRPEERL